MVSNSMTGIYVESLQLPLQKQRNVYEETPRFTSIKDVCGFTNINSKAQPWCALLKPALERQPECDDHEVYSSIDIVNLLKTALATRLKKLHVLATERVAKAVEDLGRQDASAAQKAKARLESRLAATLQFFLDLGPQKYDRKTRERILTVDASTTGVSWLKTPERANLNEGRASLAPTRRKLLRGMDAAAESEGATESAADKPAEAEKSAEADAHANSDDEFAEASDDDAEKEKGPPPDSELRAGSKRSRAAPSRLQDQAEPSRKKGKKEKQAAAAAKVSNVCMCAICKPSANHS